MKKFYFFTLIFFVIPLNLFSEEIFFSLKKNIVNVRYGPSFESPIKYVYKKINLPIKQIDKKENWRRVIDSKNNSGWIHWSQLKKASNFSEPLATIKKGRVLVLQKCDGAWCKVKSDNFKGWIKKNNIWGTTN